MILFRLYLENDNLRLIWKKPSKLTGENCVQRSIREMFHEMGRLSVGRNKGKEIRSRD